MTIPGTLRRSIATVSLSGTLEEKLDAIASAGFEGVELFENDLVSCPWSPPQIRDRCTDLGLAIELYQPFRDFEALPREAHAPALRRARLKLELAEQLGAPIMLVCSNVSPDTIDDDALAARDLQELGALAADHGVRIAYEALAWGRHVDSYLHSWKIVNAAHHENVGICLDSFHILSRGDTLSDLPEVPGHKVFFLQLADAPYVSMDVLQWSRHHRCFPGQGSFDLVGFLDQVLASGYRGPLSLEIFNDVIRRADAGRTAVDGLRSLLALEDALARRGDAPPGEQAECGDMSSTQALPELRSLPRTSSLRAISAAELQSDGISAPALERSLSAMGFEAERLPPEGGHRCWRNGAARLTVRRDVGRNGDRARGDALISGLALRCEDPRQLVERARGLLAPVRWTGRDGGAELPAVMAPDGRAIELWSPEVGASTSEGAGTLDPSVALTGIDHVVLSQLFDYFDEAMLFYRAVIGLRPQEHEELASPDGLLRSRALSSHCGNVRIALNAAITGGGTAHLGDRQHIAFSCTDIFSMATRWRDAGVPVLHIPDNYYADLLARLGLDASFIASLQELDLLYDRDASGGELFHLYTETVGDKLFFELVHRVAPYDGYGAVNAAVRMSAQRWRERDGAAR